MQPLATVVLEHVTPAGRHHDWLIQPPPHLNLPGLVTFRVQPAPDTWLDLQRLVLIPLPLHREAYLTYQGPLTHGRGHVTRRATGDIVVHRWTDAHIALDVRWTSRTLHAQLSPMTTSPQGLWQVAFEPTSAR